MPRRTARLSVLLARDAPVGVIFRRGPSKSVLLCRWRTDTDAIEEGQWLRGRIYEHRCDLSPSGDKLVYFAAKWKGEHESFTAVSKPPWLTALLLFPKGDAWGGGGLFEKEMRLALNHPPSQTALAGSAKLPKRFQVVPFGSWPGAGEDEPIWHARLVRDGWTLLSQGTAHEHHDPTAYWWRLDPPRVYSKRAPRDRSVSLELHLTAVAEKNGPWYTMEHVLVAGGERRPLGAESFADFDHGGHLVFARRGRLLRLRRPAMCALELDEAATIVDLGDRAFVARRSPPAARLWR